MAHDRCNCYFSFWAIFALLDPPLPPTAQKMKSSKDEENPWRYHHLTLVHKNHDHMF